jgi:glutathione-regulated potassium-efflux system ancillary protein KefG
MPTVDTADLIDARGVAEVLGLSHPNSVSTYQHRYPDMPRPVVDLGEGRCKMWLRTEVVSWDQRRTVQSPGDQAEGKRR